MEMKKFIHQIVQPIYYVVTEELNSRFPLSWKWEWRIKKSSSKIRRSRQYFCDRKLKVESRSQHKMWMILKAIRPLSRLYLAKNEDSKEATHIRISLFFSCFAQFDLHMSLSALILQGNSLYCYYSFLILVLLRCQDVLAKHRKFTSCSNMSIYLAVTFIKSVSAS